MAVRPPTRAHVLALGAIAAIGLVRALFWVAVLPVPTVVDEAQHYGYVESLVEHHHIPVTGRDVVDRDDLRMQKDNVVAPLAAAPLPVDPSDPRWSFAKQQYEGFQGPPYYVLMAPVYAAARPFGVDAAVLAMRVATVLVVLAAVPLTYLLARELFPDHPAAWLLSPAALVGVDSVVGNLSQVTNDALMVPLGAAVLWLVARGVRRPTARGAVAGGAVFGLAVVAKASGGALAPTVGLALAAVVAVHRRTLAVALRYLAWYVGAAAVVVAPWILFNEYVYGAPTGVGANAAITVPYIGRRVFTRGTVEALVRATRATLWMPQVATSAWPTRLWELAVAAGVVAVAVAMVAVARRRSRAGRRELAGSLWLVTSAPIGFGVLLYGLFVQADGGGEILGRHLVVLLPGLAVVVAGGVAMVAGRLAVPVTLGFLAVVTALGAPAAVRWLDATYATPIIERAAPVAGSQPLADRLSPVSSIAVRAGCPVTLIGVTAAPDAPAPPVLSTGGRPATFVAADGHFSVYRLAEPIPPRAVVRVDVDPSVPIGTWDGDPTRRVYCATKDPRATRFRTLHHPHHPLHVPYGVARAWPWAGAVAFAVAAAASLASVLTNWRSECTPERGI